MSLLWRAKTLGGERPALWKVTRSSTAAALRLMTGLQPKRSLTAKAKAMRRSCEAPPYSRLPELLHRTWKPVGGMPIAPVCMRAASLLSINVTLLGHASWKLDRGTRRSAWRTREGGALRTRIAESAEEVEAQVPVCSLHNPRTERRHAGLGPKV